GGPVSGGQVIVVAGDHSHLQSVLSEYLRHYNRERPPRGFSLETPPPIEWGQPALDEPGAPEPVIEQSQDLPGVEASGSEATFDEPAFDVGPPIGDEAEIIEDLEPMPFEEIDTQTGVLVPPPVAQGADAFAAEPADLLPEGPGKPFEADDQSVSVAQYDTADVGDFPSPVQGGRDDHLQETMIDKADAVATGDAERSAFESLAGMDRDLSSDQDGLAASDAGPGHEVDDLVAAVLGPQETVEPTGGAVQPPPAPSSPAPVVFDDRDPFIEAGWEQPAVESPVGTGVLVIDEEDQSPVSVTAGDNSLALKLTGTGAIVESGQVRALDVEVPVPGDWVGNRKVTLQLRLTLLPISEDENDGTNNPA
ncbi:MAG: hypothetical protein ABFS37_15840, partial [Acidobacteriota bacterium]